ncbi:HAD family hydrolase [Porcipelethomonas sp.]|uniref:HAD family hydrolase n=1 Tax=Porcipelethomonas sp. TaxID=2981675 RepID=UPI003EF7C8F1
MKQLFISDLDGTLLDSSGQVSDDTAQILNKCIADGVEFTFATARTASSAVKITEKININVPCILMNGVSIYDIPGKKYIKNEFIDCKTAAAVIEIFKRHNAMPFMYKIENNSLYALYSGFENKQMYEFFVIRQDKYDKPFVKCEDLTEKADGSIVYFTILGEYEKLSGIKNELEKLPEINIAFYRDVYNKGLWFLEVFDKKASKSEGIKFLREYCGYDVITCFGDNLNDIPMFMASDRKIAVGNAHDEIKAAADEVIGTNDSDSVAHWINKNYR